MLPPPPRVSSFRGTLQTVPSRRDHGAGAAHLLAAVAACERIAFHGTINVHVHINIHAVVDVLQWRVAVLAAW
jgi:hypothetical protein